MKANYISKIVTLVLIVLCFGYYAEAQAVGTTFTYADLVYYITVDANENHPGYVRVNGHKDGTAATGSVFIPREVHKWGYTYYVDAVADNAFEYCYYLTGALTIENGVKRIGSCAFDCCRFADTLYLGNVENIGYAAFRNCDFTGLLNIPNTVTTLGDAAFSGCSGFTGNLVVPNTITEIGAYVFNGCSGFHGTLTIPNTCTSIGEGAFADCSFSGTLTIPNTCTSIGSYAFWNCGFTGALTIPNAVTTIGESAFYGCTGFSSLTLPNALEEISKESFKNCYGLSGTLTIPNSVKKINEGAFAGCSGFTGSLTIPNSVNYIFKSAFEGCSGMTGTLTIGPNVLSIYDKAFKNCGFSGEVYVRRVTSITELRGSEPFYGVPSTNLTVYFPRGDEYLASNWHDHFSNITENRDFTVGDFCYYATSGTNVKVTGMSTANPNVSGSVTVPSEVVWVDNVYNVTAIGDDFLKDSDVSMLTIPSSITSIGNNAFSNCSHLTNNTVTVQATTPPTLGTNAFAGIPCTILRVPSTAVAAYQASPWHDIFTTISGYSTEFTSGSLIYRIVDGQSVAVTHHANGQSATGSLNIPATVTSGGTTYNVVGISHNAFNECTGLTSLTLPNTLQWIGSSAFYGCHGLTGTLTIPESVTTIHSNAFYYCDGFTGDLVIPNSVTLLGYSAFYYCSGFNGTLTISESLTTIYGNTFYMCSGLTGDITIPEGVTSIEGQAFMCYNEPASFNGTLTIPSTVKSIGSWAFYNCNALSAVNCRAIEPPAVGYAIFQNVPLTTLHVPFGCAGAYTASSWHDLFTNIVADEYIEVGEYRFKEAGETELSVYEHKDGAAASGYKTIPESVSYMGTTYTVTTIGNNVFKGSDIGGIVIPATITSIGDNAISNCQNLLDVEVRAETPPTLGANAFNNIASYWLTIPCGCTAAYEASSWSDVFLYYHEGCESVKSAEESIFSLYPNPTYGVMKIKAENLKNIEIFNIMGQRVFGANVSGDEFEYNFGGTTGMYLVRIETSRGVETKRVLVVKH